MRHARPPGDKSISHRALIISAVASGTSRIRGLLVSRDIEATASGLRELGAEIPESLHGTVDVPGPTRFGDPQEIVDCGNSGTTARLLLGVAAGAAVGAVLDGDSSLRERPMDRVVYPLQAMGARMRYVERRGRLPVEVLGRSTGSLRPLRHRPRVASAQVKSALLLAGLLGRVNVEVVEPGRSRDHTERLLAAAGAPIEVRSSGPGPRVSLRAGREAWDGILSPLDLDVPGDPSSAAFLIAAAATSGEPLTVEGVSLNETRTGFLDVLERMGMEIERHPKGRTAGEPAGDLVARPGPLAPFEIGPEEVPRLLDEVPVLGVLAARAQGISRLRGAEELRVKESDRLSLMARNLRALGVTCRELPDGLEITGTRERLEGRVVTGGDHRIAMAFGALGLDPASSVEVDDPGCVEISYPGFWEELRRLS